MSEEHRFPTIRDFRDCLSKLIELGLGEQPVQILVAPDSTMQAELRLRATAGRL